MITGVLIARNEEGMVAQWAQQMSWCDELLLVDNASTDATARVAREHGMTVVTEHDRDFARLRNIALERAKGDWLVYIDADEEVSPELAKDIVEATNQPNTHTLRLRRQDIFWGTAVRYGEVAQAYRKGIIRVIRKGSGTWKGRVHEAFQPKKQSGSLTIETPLIHRSHEDVKSFLDDVNLYSTLRAEELYHKGVRVTWKDVLIRPCVKFCYTYFVKMGFRDGPAGFVYAFMMSFHAFLVRAKMYMLHAGVTQVGQHH